MKMKGLILWSS